MSGHRPWAEVRAERGASPEQEAEIAEHRRAMEAVLRLAEAREHAGVTQVALATLLGTSQSNVSRIEREDDVYLSTIREYVEALGGELEINAVFPERTIALLIER